MKKFYYITTFVLFFIIMACISTNSHAYLYGDVDLDGKVTSADSRIILRFGVGSEKLSPIQAKLADVDNNGSISASDARIALRMSTGLEKTKKCPAR